MDRYRTQQRHRRRLDRRIVGPANPPGGNGGDCGHGNPERRILLTGRRYNRRMAFVSRREFLGATAAATLTTARSYSEIKGSNERLRVGVIGCGGQAMGHMRALKKNKDNDNVATIAVCDIYDKRLAQAAELTDGKPYKNYHDLL